MSPILKGSLNNARGIHCILCSSTLKIHASYRKEIYEKGTMGTLSLLDLCIMLLQTENKSNGSHGKSLLQHIPSTRDPNW